MSKLYNVTIEYLGLKKQYKFTDSTICLGADGDFIIMDSEGIKINFRAMSCKVFEIAANVIIINGFTPAPRYFTAYCVYVDQPLTKQEPHED